MTSGTSEPGASLMNTYNRLPLALVKGEGVYVWDENDSRYLDFSAGLAVCNLGHAPVQVGNRLKAQLDTLWHCSNLYRIPGQEQLADRLTASSFADKVFFGNSGAEANEGALKLARRYSAKVRQSTARDIVTFQQSFHGRTLATLTATGQEKFHDGFDPLMPGFRYLPLNDQEALSGIDSQVCAVLVELVQGEGGVIPADRDWVQQLYTLCRDKGILFMVDEVQTGCGRCGTLFAYEQYGITPDVMTLAKGLGSGFPIGALLATAEAAQGLAPGTHASTFGGSPLAATAGLATLEELLQPGFLDRAAETAAYLEQRLLELNQRFACIQAVRGLGFLWGLVLPERAAAVVTAARAKGLLLLTAGSDVVRLAPPLIVSAAEIDTAVDTIASVLTEMNES